MIKIFDEDNDVIKVSKSYIEEAINLYIKNNIIDAVFSSVKIEKNSHNNAKDYSVILKINSQKSNVDYKKLEWYMENIKFYLYKNFNLNCVVAIGLD